MGKSDGKWPSDQDVLLLENLKILDTVPRPEPDLYRLVRVSVGAIEKWGTRTEDGYRISATWGPQQGDGTWLVQFEIDYSDRLELP